MVGSSYRRPQVSASGPIETWDLLYGIHSGIPICCVMEFVGLGMRGVIERNIERIDAHPVIMGDASPIRYVPCAICFLEIVEGREKPVKTHSCHRKDKRCREFSKLAEQLIGKPLLFMMGGE